MTPRLKPQTVAVLDLLRRRGPLGVTHLEAFTAVGTFRLSGRVLELRQAGYQVETIYVSTSSHKRVARYYLHEEPVQMAAGL